MKKKVIIRILKYNDDYFAESKNRKLKIFNSVEEAIISDNHRVRTAKVILTTIYKHLLEEKNYCWIHFIDNKEYVKLDQNAKTMYNRGILSKVVSVN